MKTKEIIQLSVAGGLIIILICLNTFVLMRKTPQSKKADNQNVPVLRTMASLTQDQNKEAKSLFLALKEESAGFQYDRDPFQKVPKAVITDSGPSFYIEGIFWDTEKPTAIVNDRIVEKGTVLNGHTVVDIKKDRVILNDGTTDIELFMDM